MCTAATGLSLRPRPVHLRDRGGGNRRAEFAEQLADIPFEIVADDPAGDIVGEGWKAVLKRLELEGAARANEVRPCGEELPEFDVAGSERGKGGCHRVRFALAGAACAQFGDRQAQPRRPRELRDLLGRHQRVIGGQRAARAQQIEAVPYAGEHQMRHPEWMATTPPVRLR